MKRARKGFTLVEVVCVLVIIAIIAAIAVPNISGYIKKSKENNCRSVMTNFVNDLEYKIVSKRYYDVSELNNELVEYARSQATVFDDTRTENDGTFQWLNEKVEASGICPNGGQYNVEWTITPGSEEKLSSARVEVKLCTCDCMQGEESLSVNTHTLTAALIADTDYIIANQTEEEIYLKEIEKIISRIQGNNSNPSGIDDIAEEINRNSQYKIAGVTVAENNNSNIQVEWICIDHHINFDVPDNEKSHKLVTLKNGKPVIKEYSEDELKDLNNRPPAEGNAGSFLYLDGLNYTNTNSYRVADTDSSSSVCWIQRDGSWYVQKNNVTDGINLSPKSDREYFNAEDDSFSPAPEQIEEYSNYIENYYNDRQALISERELQSISVSLKSTPDFSNINNFRNSITINASYSDNSLVKFNHISTSDMESDDYTIKNGFVILDSVPAYAARWAGIYNNAELSASEKEALSVIINDEERVINSFLNGEANTIYIVYQEYCKRFNPETNEYTYTPVTRYAALTAESREFTVPDDSVVANLNSDGTITVNGNTTITVGGQKINIPKTVTQPMADECFSYSIKEWVNGVQVEKDLKSQILSGTSTGNGADVFFKYGTMESPVKIGTMKSDSNNIKVEYSQDENKEKILRLDDIKVYASKKFDFTNLQNSTSSCTEDANELPHISELKDGDSSLAYYIGTYSNAYTEEGEQSFIDRINSGDNGTNSGIFLTSDINKRYARFGIDNKNLVWSYNNDNSGVLKTENFSVDFNYVFTLGSENQAVVSGNGIIQKELKHKTDNESDGFYLSYNSNASWNEADDSELEGKLNYRTQNAYLNYRYDNQTGQICAVSNYLTGIKATYDNTKGDKFSYDNLSAEADYKIAIDSNVSGKWRDDSQIRYVFSHSLPLKHNTRPAESTPELVYYLASFDKNVNNIESVRPAESTVISKLSTGVSDNFHVVYYDNDFAYDDIYVNVKAGINPPDVIYLPYTDDSILKPNPARVIAYLGISSDVSIRSTYSGYWSKDKPDGSLPYVEVQPDSDSDTYYYISDGKTYSITRIGENDLQAGAGSPDRNVKLYNLAGNNNSGPVISSLSIEDGVVEIGSYAFRDVKMYENGTVSVPGSVKVIGNNAFENLGSNGTGSENDTDSNLVSLTIGTPDASGNLVSHLEIIGANAFSGCSNLSAMNQFVIPESVRFIGDGAFSNFGLPSGKLVINGISETDETKTAGGAASASDSGNVAHAIEIDGVEETGMISGRIFGDLSKLNIQSLEIGGSVDKIGNGAFKGLKFKNSDRASVSLVGNVCTIGANAFENADLGSKLTLGDKVAYIENQAFKDCSTYSGNLEFGGSINTIGSEAFSGWSNVTGDLEIPDSVERIDPEAFDGFASAKTGSSSYGSLTVLGGSFNKGTELGGGIFTNAKFKNVTIGGKVKKISARAFKNAPLKESTPYGELKGTLTLSGNITEIGLAAFEDCTGFTGSLILPENENFTEIGDAAFNGCFGFTGDLEIPSNVRKIGSRTFMGCTGFNGALVLHKGLTDIGLEAFKDCIRFSGGLTIPENITGKIGNCAFENFAGNDNTAAGPLVIKSGSFSSGTKLGGFIFTGAKFTDVIIGGSVKEISANAFHNAESETLEITNDKYKDDKEAEKVTTSNHSVKADYSRITGSVIIENTVNKIDDFAFYDCSNLSGQLVFNALTDTEGNLIREESGKIRISNTEGLNYIGEGVFRNCRNISGELFIPQTVTTIERSAFKMFGDGSGKLTVYGGSNGTKLGYVIPDMKKDSDGNDTETRVEVDHPIFQDAKFRGVTIGGNVTQICEGAFDNSNYLYIRDNLNKQFEEKVKELKGQNLTEESSEYKEEKARHEKELEFIKNNYSYEDLLGNLVIENSVTQIDHAAFKGCRFTGGTLNFANVTSVGANAFEDCSSMAAVITDMSKVKTFGEAAFKKCEKLTSTYNSNGDLQLTDATHIEKHAFFECRSFSGKLFIPSAVSIGEGAFVRCEKLSGGVTIPKTVTTLGQSAFKQFGSSDSSTAGVLVIEGGTLDNGKVVIKDYPSGPIFAGAKFNSVTIGGNVDIIDSNVFNNWKHSSRFPKLSDEAADKTNKEDMNFNYDFSKITGSLTIQGKVSQISEYAFGCCEFDNITINSCVETIGFNAFMYTGSGNGELKIYGTSKSDGSVGENIFSGSHFENVTVGGSVSKIDYNFMYHKPDWSKEYSYGTSKYMIPYDYSNIRGTLKIGKGVREINEHAFQNCSGIDGEVILSDASVTNGTENNGLVTIGKEAFDGCTNVSYKTDGKSLKNVVISEFRKDINGLVIPDTVTSIGDGAFRNFSKLSDNPGYLWMHAGSSSNGNIIDKNKFTGSRFCGVYIGDRISEIADDAFKTMDYVEVDENGAKHEDSKDNVFDRGYTRWTGDLFIDGGVVGNDEGPKNGVRTIGRSAFSNCYGFDGQLAIINGVETIRQDAFLRCSYFTGGLEIPWSVKTIQRCAFKSFADRCPDDKTGPLVLYAGTCNDGKTLGTSRTSDFNKDETVSGDTFTAGEETIPVFPYSKFKDVKICGKIEKVSNKFFDNEEGLSTYAKKDESGNYIMENGKYVMSDSHTHDYFNLKGNLIISRNVKEIGTMAFYRCGFDGYLKMNQFISSYGVILSEDDDNVKSNPNAYGTGLTKIGQQAFSDCFDFYTASGISDADRVVTVPDTVTSMSEGVFFRFSENASSPAALRILGGSSGTEIGPGVYKNAYFRNVFIGGKVTKVQNETFKGFKNLTGNLVLSDDCKEIGTESFHSCGFTGSIDLGNIQKIGQGAFAGCNKFYTAASGEVKIPDSVIELKEDAFYKFAYDSLTPPSLTVRGGTKNENNDIVLEKKIFSYAKFNNVTIGGAVTKIADYCMSNVSDPQTNKFYDDDGWEYVNGTDSERTWTVTKTYNVLYRKNGNNQEKIKDERTGWIYKDYSKLYEDIHGTLTICDNVKSVGKLSFDETKFDSLFIEYGQRDIQQLAFRNSGTGNGSVTIKAWTTSDKCLGNGSADNGWFTGANYRDVTIDGSNGGISTIKPNFMNMLAADINTKLYKDNVNETVEHNYSNIKGSLTIKNVNTISSWTFTKSGFTGDLVLSNVNSIGESAFSQCAFTGKLELDGVESIGESAFDNCVNFYSNSTDREFIVPYSVTAIGKNAFRGFSNKSNNPVQLTFEGCMEINPIVINGVTYDHLIRADRFPNSKFKNIRFNTHDGVIFDWAFYHERGNTDKNYSNWSGTITITSEIKGVDYRSFGNHSGSIKIEDTNRTYVCTNDGKADHSSPNGHKWELAKNGYNGYLK